MFNNYLIYLAFITAKITKFFEAQKPYIFCKKGCAKCCKNAEFPYTKIEFQYLMSGVSLLDKDIKKNILQNIRSVLEERAMFNAENFKYSCPFLIDDVCAVYNYRGIICRSFGLLNIGTDGRVKVPFCCYQGMNYSNVIDEETHMISPEKFKAAGFKEIPSAYNVNYYFLTDPDFEKTFGFEFGDIKPLIDWFLDNESLGFNPFEILEGKNENSMVLK